MRVVMMGTGAFALPTFSWLCESTHEVAALVTKPLKGSARGRRPVARPMFEAARERGVVIYEPARMNDPQSVAWLQAQRPDVVVVCDYGEILRQEVLSVAPLGAINLHGSLLPKYRGAAPVAWAILCGETRTGVTVFRMTAQLDAGPILVQRAVEIGPEETAVELEARLARLGVDAVAEALALLAAWDGHSPLGTPQNIAEVTKAPRLTKAQGRVDWRRPAPVIVNQVRALVPWPTTYTFWAPTDDSGRLQRIILNRVSVVPQPAVTAEVGVEPGTVVAADAQRLWVRAGEATCLAIELLQPEGRRPMTAGEFLRGHKLRVGSRFV